MTQEINWAAPVVGKLEVGKTYVDRAGRDRQLNSHVGCLFHEKKTGLHWWNCGSYNNDTDQRHVLDLIAEYTPPAPLKMWMNTYPDQMTMGHGTEAAAKRRAASDAIRIAVPVTITEGH